jgi:hypothetical protein
VIVGEAEQARRKAVRDYIERFHQVDGWCQPTAAAMLGELLWHQERAGIRGGIAEIGIHHGKSFIALALAARPKDPLIAVDLFAMQERNTDKSGSGDRSVFEANLRSFAPQAVVQILEMDSLDLSGNEAAYGFQGLRLLSIDGGHTKHMTCNDLHIADRALCEAGICVLDDVLNGHWTGVISGLFDFMQQSQSLVPVALIPNKLVMARPAWRDRYLGFMGDAFATVREKRHLELGNGFIDVFGEFPDMPLAPLSPRQEPPARRKLALWPFPLK